MHRRGVTEDLEALESSQSRVMSDTPSGRGTLSPLRTHMTYTLHTLLRPQESRLQKSISSHPYSSCFFLLQLQALRPRANMLQYVNCPMQV